MTKGELENEMLEAVETTCDHYCKYPYEIYDSEELNQICDECPLNKLYSRLIKEEVR